MGAKGHAILAHAAFDRRSTLQMRWRSVTTMGRLDLQEYHKELDQALTSGEWFMRNAALIALQTGERARAVGMVAALA